MDALLNTVSYNDRAAFNRDLIWSLLWQLHQPGWPHEGWVSPRQVYDLWLDGRSECGIAYAEDWMGPCRYFSYIIKRLVGEGRVERRDVSHKHPTYRAIQPDDGERRI